MFTFAFESEVESFVDAHSSHDLPAMVDRAYAVDAAEWEAQHGTPLRMLSIKKTESLEWVNYRGSTLGRDVVERLARDTHYRKQMRVYVRSLDPSRGGRARRRKLCSSPG